jgi:HEPN domain-containing protein
MTPRKSERLFPPGYASELLRIAEGDLATAQFLLNGFDLDIRQENLFYMAQQAIEKGLKAALCHAGKPVPLVHEIGALVAKLPDEVQPPFGYELGRLNEFAASRRYEEGRVSLTKEEAEDVLATARAVLDWAHDFIGGARVAGP